MSWMSVTFLITRPIERKPYPLSSLNTYGNERPHEYQREYQREYQCEYQRDYYYPQPPVYYRDPYDDRGYDREYNDYDRYYGYNRHYEYDLYCRNERYTQDSTLDQRSPRGCYHRDAPMSYDRDFTFNPYERRRNNSFNDVYSTRRLSNDRDVYRDNRFNEERITDNIVSQTQKRSENNRERLDK